MTLKAIFDSLEGLDDATKAPSTKSGRRPRREYVQKGDRVNLSDRQAKYPLLNG
jgi:hypothetical protein